MDPATDDRDMTERVEEVGNGLIFRDIKEDLRVIAHGVLESNLKEFTDAVGSLQVRQWHTLIICICISMFMCVCV